MVKLKAGDQFIIKPNESTYEYCTMCGIPKEALGQPWFVTRDTTLLNEGTSLTTTYNGVKFDVFFYTHEIVPKTLEELMEEYLCQS